MSIPVKWDNGSAVYSRASNRPAFSKDEGQDWFLGRLQRTPDGLYAVWKWRPSGYVYLGTLPHLDALARLR